VFVTFKLLSVGKTMPELHRYRPQPGVKCGLADLRTSGCCNG